MPDAIATWRVAVPAAPAGYDVLCGRGALARLPDVLDGVGASGRVVVCTDTTVRELHGPGALSMLRASGRDTLLWAMPAGERHKTLATVEQAYTYLAAQRVERGDTIVALGGGVVGDLAGLVAATYLRGLRLVQVPTTLVAQVDSAIGGKVGVDLPVGKNLVGAFYQPAAVVADTDLLATLPQREWRAGMAEVIKHGIIRDTALLDVLEESAASASVRDPERAAALVARAAAVKVSVVGDDPFERGLRRILNYGHTLGHAIEREAGYGTVLHGEAVAWGMAAAARLGAQNGTCDQEFVAWQDEFLARYGLLGPLPALSVEGLLTAIQQDKKSASGRIHWVLPCAPGQVVVTDDVTATSVRAAASWLIGAACRAT